LPKAEPTGSSQPLLPPPTNNHAQSRSQHGYLSQCHYTTQEPIASFHQWAGAFTTGLILRLLSRHPLNVSARQLDQWPWGLDSPDWQLILQNPWKLPSPRPVALTTSEDTIDSLRVWLDDVHREPPSPIPSLQNSWASNSLSRPSSAAAGFPGSNLPSASVPRHISYDFAAGIQSSPSSASVSLPSAMLNAPSPEPSFATSISHASRERDLSMSRYVHTQHLRPVMWARVHRLPDDVRQLRRLVLELSLAGSTIAHNENESSNVSSTGASMRWFVESVGSMCVAVVRTFEVMQLPDTPPLVCGPVRVLCMQVANDLLRHVH